MRIAFGGLHTECSTYNPVLAGADQFTVLRGDAMFTAPYFDCLKSYQATFVPTLHARAVPGGPVSRAAYDAFKSEFLEGLRASLPIDGLYLAMHGAVFVEGMFDAEGDWISAAREIVGPDIPIAVSYDLHGNLSQKIIDAIDIYSTYRTAPHIDVDETQHRTLTMLMRSLETGICPSLCWAPVPVLWPGERTSTVDEPANSLYAALPALDRIEGIWDASFNIGYVWADEPRATAAAIFTGTDRAAMAREAAALAQKYWHLRDAFNFGSETGPLDTLVAKAVASSTRPVVLADSGDNPTGGGVGDRADMLRELIAARAKNTIVAGITDAPAVSRCFAAGVGTTLDLSAGATLDTEGSAPVSCTATVMRLYPGQGPATNQAIVQLSGSAEITLALSAHRRPYHDFEDFAALGLDPRNAAIVAVKSGYLSPDLAAIANPNLMALSPGVVDQDVARLPRPNKTISTYPFETEFEFSPNVAWSRRSTAGISTGG